MAQYCLLSKGIAMRYVLPLLAALVFAAGCDGKPPVQPGNDGAQNGTEDRPSENQTDGVMPDGGSENGEKPALPRPEIPAADAETQARIDKFLAIALDGSAKMDERQDAVLVGLVNTGVIATTGVLRLTFNPNANGHCAVWAQKFFRLLPEKEAYKALVLHLYHDDAQVRAAANAMLVTLTGKRDIGYDADMDEASRHKAIKRWKKALGIRE